jgi:hypothetical protein
MTKCPHCRATFAGAEDLRRHSVRTEYGNFSRCMDWRELRDAGWRLSADRGWGAPARYRGVSA